jgi:alpha-L-fucosidase 2
MNLLNAELPRRGFLTASGWAAGAIVLSSGLLDSPRALGLPASVALPERGIFDTSPTDSWTDAFLSGNGEYGAMLLGRPESERVVFNHHRFVLPNGTRDLQPPNLAPRLGSVQDKAIADDFAGATSEFTSGWSLLWTQTYHPGYALKIDAPAMSSHSDYIRTTDFGTGEVQHAWTTGAGTWKRRMFVSRGSATIVHEIIPPAGASIDLVLGADTALPGAPSSVGYTVTPTASGRNGYLGVRGTYPAGQGAYGFEGVTRAVITGSASSIKPVGQTLVVKKATRVILLTKLARYNSAAQWSGQPLHAALGVLLTDYDALLRRHLPLHSALVDGSSLRLDVSASDRDLSAPALTQRQSAHRSSVDLALLEAMYDSGRYLFASSSGVLPPRLTGIWTGEWGGAWADDFTTDANVNLQVAGGNILTHADAMSGYFDLVLGQLDHWRTNALRLYGARGFLAPSRTDGEHGYMHHFEPGFPGHCWLGGADWMLYPLLEYCQVSGDETFYRTKLAPVLMELALFYEDVLTRTDANGKVVFVPSFSMENSPASTNHMLSINATGEIEAGRHALTSAIDAANALGVEQGPGAGVARWTALLEKLPDYVINSDGALAEWAWPGLTDRYNHRHVHHMYGAWPLHAITPEDQPVVAEAAHRALVKRGDENYSGHGSLHRALAFARLKDGNGVYDNVRKILGSNMVFRSLMTSHNPELHTYNADSAHALPAVVAEAVVDTRPGFLEVLPALPDQLQRGELTGVRGRNRVLVERVAWDLAAGTVSATLVSAVAQEMTLLCRRGITAFAATNAAVSDSPLGAHARVLQLSSGARVEVSISLLPTTCRLVNRLTGLVMDVDGASDSDGAAVLQWHWSGAANQKWRLQVGYGGGYRFKSVKSDKVLDNPGSSTTAGERLAQWADTFSRNQWWKPLPTTAGYVQLVNVASGLCLDIEGASVTPGARLVQSAPVVAAASQEWRIESV